MEDDRQKNFSKQVIIPLERSQPITLSGGLKFEPGLCCRVVSLDKKLSSTLSLFTQVYKWVQAIIMLEGNLAMD